MIAKKEGRKEVRFQRFLEGSNRQTSLNVRKESEPTALHNQKKNDREMYLDHLMIDLSYLYVR